MPANPSDADEAAAADANTSSETIAGVGDNVEILRTGSPFAPGSVSDAVGPPETPQTSSQSASQSGLQPAPEVLTDGVMKYTAKGSATASLMVVFFASVAAWLFPAGGVLIAILGCVLAVGGMFSDYRMPSAALLVVHLGLFVASYTFAIQ